jgi:hypothetical protein
MSRYTKIKDCEIPGVEFNKPTDDIEDAIERKTDNIQYYKEKFKMLAACTPKDMFPEDTMFELNKEFDDIFECLVEEISERSRLYIIDLNRKDIVNQYEEISKENTKD